MTDLHHFTNSIHLNQVMKLDTFQANAVLETLKIRGC